MTDAILLRGRLKKGKGMQISVTSLIIKACANVLPSFPILSGIWEGKNRLICPAPNEIAIFGPVRVGDYLGGHFFIDKANQKTLFQISIELNSQVNELKSKLPHEVIWPDTSAMLPAFEITNEGSIGPIEGGYLPQRSFSPSWLGICSILEKPVVKDGQIMIRQMMNVFLNWDHRAMMASTPVEFLTQLKKNLEEPSAYLV
jgi:pyruvate/2-oxoglutarate dehydrogenase complex dihydrolipoamide acyltransferase (E2) component